MAMIIFNHRQNIERMGSWGMKTVSSQFVFYAAVLMLAAAVPNESHAGSSRKVYQLESSVYELEKVLMSFEVEGVSLGMKVPAMDEILTRNGYKLKKKSQVRKRTSYFYARGKGRIYFKVGILTTKNTDTTANVLQIDIPNASGKQSIDDEMHRLLKTFDGFDNSCQWKIKKGFFKCQELTDTNNLIIEVRSSRKRIRYKIYNVASNEAKRRASARDRAAARAKKAKADKTNEKTSQKEGSSQDIRKKSNSGLHKENTTKKPVAGKSSPDKSKPGLVPVKRNRVREFEDALMSYEVEGVSIGMKASEFKVVLVSNGYTFKANALENKRGSYKYVGLKKTRMGYQIILSTNPKGGAVRGMTVSLRFADGGRTDAESMRRKEARRELETNRVLKLFGELGNVCKVNGGNVRCHAYTDTNELSIKANFSSSSFEYYIYNDVSYEAKRRASQAATQPRALAHERKRKAEQEALRKKKYDDLRKWIATKKSGAGNGSPEERKYGKYLEAAKKRIAELDKLPPTFDTMAKIQEEYFPTSRSESSLSVVFGFRDAPNKEYRFNKELIKKSGNNFRAWLTILADWKAKDVTTHMLSKYPANLDGLLQFVKDSQAEALALFKYYRIYKYVGYDILGKIYSETVKKKGDEYFVPGMKTLIAKLKPFQGKDYSRLKEINSLNDGIENMYNAINSGEEWYDKEARLLYNEFKKSYESNHDSMIEKSIPVLVGWINSLTPSMTAVKALNKFTKEAFGKKRYDRRERFKKLFKAIGEKRIASNPDGYYRPDIILSLQREYWHEVKYAALDDIAYFSTTYKEINKRCPGIATDGQMRVFDSHTSSKTMRAMDRIRGGDFLSDKEEEMAVTLVLNAMANRPGCRTDDYGNITGCVSVEESRRLTQALMTSSSAIYDTDKFLSKNSCSNKSTSQYIKLLTEFSDLTPKGTPPGFITKFPY